MRSFPVSFAAALAVAGVLVSGGCGDPATGGAHDADAVHDHAHEHAAEPGTHEHAAPHGGTLVELQHEGANIELLLDATTGTLTAWILDGCCEKPVRITQETIPVQIVAGGMAFRIDLAARESAMTGEKRGDTSEFAGQHDRLRGASSFKGLIENVAVAGRSFQGVKFEYARSPK